MYLVFHILRSHGSNVVLFATEHKCTSGRGPYTSIFRFDYSGVCLTEQLLMASHIRFGQQLGPRKHQRGDFFLL